MTSAAAHQPSISIAGPPVLWSLHFVFVYVFVSLACLWGWDRYTLIGGGLIEWVVAAATLVACGLIALIGLWAWREIRTLPETSDGRERFVATVGMMSSALFLAATVMVGFLTLPRPSCY